MARRRRPLGAAGKEARKPPQVRPAHTPQPPPPPRPTTSPDQQDRRQEARRSNVARGAPATGGPGRVERRRGGNFLSKPHRIEDVQKHLRQQGYDVPVDGATWSKAHARALQDYIAQLTKSAFADYTQQRFAYNQAQREAQFKAERDAAMRAYELQNRPPPPADPSFLHGAKKIGGGLLDLTQGEGLKGLGGVLGGGAEELASGIAGATEPFHKVEDVFAPGGRGSTSRALERAGKGYLGVTDFARQHGGNKGLIDFLPKGPKGKYDERKTQAAGFIPEGIKSPAAAVADRVVNDIWDITAGAPGGILIGAAHPGQAVTGIQKDYANRYGPLLQGDFKTFWARNKEHPVFLGLDLAVGAGVVLKGGEVAGVLSKPGAIRRLGMEGGEFQLYRSPSRLGAHSQEVYDALSKRYPKAKGVGLESRLARHQHRERDRLLGELRSQDVHLRRKARKLSGEEQVAFDVFRRYGDQAPNFLESEINKRVFATQQEGISAKELRLQKRQIKVLEDARQAVSHPSEDLALALVEGFHLSDKTTTIRKQLGLVTDETAERITHMSARIFGDLPPIADTEARLNLWRLAHGAVGPELAEASMMFLDRMAQKVAEVTGKSAAEVYDAMFSAERAKTNLPADHPDVLFQGKPLTPDLVRQAASATDMPLRTNLMSMADALEKGTITPEQFSRWTREKLTGEWVADISDADKQVLQSLLRSAPEGGGGVAADIAASEMKNVTPQDIIGKPQQRDPAEVDRQGNLLHPGENLSRDDFYRIHDEAVKMADDLVRNGEDDFRASMEMHGYLIEHGFSFSEASTLSSSWWKQHMGNERLMRDVNAAPDHAFDPMKDPQIPGDHFPRQGEPAVAAPEPRPFEFAQGTHPEITSAFDEVWGKRGGLMDDATAYEGALDNAIRAAVRTEDYETAQVLWNEFRKQGGEDIPGIEPDALYQANWADDSKGLPYKKLTNKDLEQRARQQRAPQDWKPATGEVKGVTEFSSGKGAIEYTPIADISTVLHEPAHVIRRYLPDVYQERIAEALGWEKGKPLTRAQEEQFAEIVEGYFWRGQEPTPQLRAPMAALSRAMRELYAQAPKGGAKMAEREKAYTILDEVFDPENGLKAGDGAFYAPDTATFRGKGAGGMKGSLKRKGRKEVYKSRGVLYRQGRAMRGPEVVVKDFHRASRQMEHKLSLEKLTTFAKPIEPERFPETLGVEPGYALLNPDGHKIPRIYSETPDEEALLGMFPRELRSELKRQYDETLEQVFPANVKAVPEEMRDNLLQVPQKLADSFMGHNTYLSAASKVPGIDTLLRVVDDANTIAKAALVYGKLSYIPLNFAGNMIFLAIHAGPFAAPSLVRASGFLGRLDPELLAQMDYQVGEGSLAALAAEETGDRLQQVIHHVAEYQSAMADRLPRRAAWVYSAAKRGFTSEDGIRKLLQGSEEIWKDGITYKEALRQTSDEAEHAMVTFRGMTPFQKAVLTRAIFIYGWMRGATKYIGRLSLDKPLRADLVAHLGDQEANRVEERLGKIVSYLKGVSPIGQVEEKMGLETAQVSQLRALNPVSTGGESLYAIYNALQGRMQVEGPQPTDFMNPIIKIPAEYLFGFNSFFGQKYNNRWDAVTGQVVRIPLLKSIEGLTHENFTPADASGDALQRQPNVLKIKGDKGMFGVPLSGRWNSVLSFILGSATPYRLNVGAAQGRHREEVGVSSSYENEQFKLESGAKKYGLPAPNDQVLEELKAKADLDSKSRTAGTYVERAKLAADLFKERTGRDYYVRRAEQLDSESRAERLYNTIRHRLFRHYARYNAQISRKERRASRS